MLCPTCGETIRRIDGFSFWCPRCGTLCEVCAGVVEDFDQPQLVKRCRLLENDMAEGRALWHQRGVTEAIHPPQTGEPR